MFQALLDRVLFETPGAVGVTLMGFDGIAIDTRSVADPVFPDRGDVSLQATAIELGHVASQLTGVAASLKAGDVAELSVHTGAWVTVLRPLTPEYFVALSLKPGGNLGKGRYLMRVIGPKLIAELCA
jgi:hypothetical protein